MASLQFDTRTLRDALRWVVDHIEQNPANAADSALIINAPKDGFVVLTGGCDQSAARARIPFNGDSFDETKAVHAHSLNAIVKSAPGPTVELNLGENGVLVKSGAAKSKVTYLKTDEANVSRTETKIPRHGTVAAADLIDAVGSLATLAKEDASMPELAGVKFEIGDGKLSLAATDRSILGATKIPFVTPDGSTESVELNTLVPNRVLSSITRALPADGDVWIHWDPNNKRRLALSTDSLWVSFAVLAAADKFPPYAPILSVPAQTTIEVDRKAFSAALARTGAALGHDSIVLGISSETVDETGGEFTLKGSGTFDHEEELAARVTGEPVENALLAAQYVTQAVKSVKGETVTLVLGDTRALVTSDHSKHAKFVIPRVQSR